MGILNSNRITPEALIARGFVVGGWGSPFTRATRNTTMYELYIEKDRVKWAVMYFPLEFEGVVTPAGGQVVDMRGKVMMQKENCVDLNSYIIGVTDMTDIDVFIEQVLRNKVKPFKFRRGDFNVNLGS